MRAFLLVLLAGCAGDGQGEPLICTQIGCDSAVYVGIGPISDPVRFAGATVTLCLNASCTTLVMPDMVPAPGMRAEVSTESPHISATLANLEGHYSVGVSLIDDEHRLDDGDEYTLEFRDADGVILQHAWTAEYVVSYPNEAPCPPRCLTQSIELPAPND